MKTWALVPVKESALAKQRLSPVFSPQLRQALFSAMVADVFATLGSTASLCGFAAVTVDPAAQKLARHYGGIVIETGARSGYTDAVMSGMYELASHYQADAVLTLPMDVPLITIDDVEAMITKHDRNQGGGFTLVPSRDCRGTNATLSSPPGCVELRFGDNSFATHLRAASSAGILPSVVSLSNLALDIDCPEDIELLLAVPRSTRTHRLLADAGCRPRMLRNSHPIEAAAVQWN